MLCVALTSLFGIFMISTRKRCSVCAREREKAAAVIIRICFRVLYVKSSECWRTTNMSLISL
ncbi:hypothetical protein BJY01DRAFT_124200 [Aspergillus pseudoustus]|uniref:Uncharacterized protein n=1 Tax=Aspergillus pseudoustus TaxID=1810923 RepID=A0ABR4IRS6_9EURO